jgi:hypothetical protein
VSTSDWHDQDNYHEFKSGRDRQEYNAYRVLGLNDSLGSRRNYGRAGMVLMPCVRGANRKREAAKQPLSSSRARRCTQLGQPWVSPAGMCMLIKWRLSIEDGVHQRLCEWLKWALTREPCS